MIFGNDGEVSMSGCFNFTSAKENRIEIILGVLSQYS